MGHLVCVAVEVDIAAPPHGEVGIGHAPCILIRPYAGSVGFVLSDGLKLQGHLQATLQTTE